MMHVNQARKTLHVEVLRVTNFFSFFFLSFTFHFDVVDSCVPHSNTFNAKFRSKNNAIVSIEKEDQKKSNKFARHLA